MFDYHSGLKGISVVVDDSNQTATERTRRSYIDAVKSKISNIVIKAIEIMPEGGLTQCLWANEYALAGNTDK